MKEKTPVRFEVTHHLPGHHAPTTTVTDTSGVNALLAQAETTGGALRIRRHTPEADPVPEAAETALQGDPRP
jgi:hypothetical protein